MELNFRDGINRSPQYGALSFLMRPVSCIALILVLVLLFYPTIKRWNLARNAKLKAVLDQVKEDDD